MSKFSRSPIILIVLLTLALLAMSAGCAAAARSQPSAATGKTGTDLPAAAGATAAGQLVERYVPRYAKGFHIEYYAGGARIIDTQIAATANTAAVAQRVLILPAGAPLPVNTTWDHRIDGYPDRVVTLASSHAGHFANLDAIGRVAGTSIKAENCFIPALKTALQNGAARYVGTGAKVDQELIAALKPQIIFVGGMQSDVEMAQKLAESGLFCFYFGDFAENDYLGRAQWIELIGACIGLDQQSRDYITASAAQIQAILARTGRLDTHPKVLWLTHSSSAPHWNVRTNQDYVNSIVTAVGGQLYFPPEATANSLSLSNEAFIPYLRGADRIIFGVSLNSYPEAKNATYFNKEGQVDFASAPAVQSGNCYVVGYDWAQDTADALGIIQSMAICLYPDEFKDLVNPGKIIPFQVK